MLRIARTGIESAIIYNASRSEGTRIVVPASVLTHPRTNHMCECVYLPPVGRLSEGLLPLRPPPLPSHPVNPSSVLLYHLVHTDGLVGHSDHVDQLLPSPSLQYSTQQQCCPSHPPPPSGRALAQLTTPFSAVKVLSHYCRAVDSQRRPWAAGGWFSPS